LRFISQVWARGAPTATSQATPTAVKCPACDWFHVVNPKTGKVLGEAEERS